jgi:hypothetical protein
MLTILLPFGKGDTTTHAMMATNSTSASAAPRSPLVAMWFRASLVSKLFVHTRQAMSAGIETEVSAVASAPLQSDHASPSRRKVQLRSTGPVTETVNDAPSG